MQETHVSTIAKNSPYALFETDKSIEQTGIRIDYGPFYFQVARAGGANTRFRDVFRQRMAPHKRAMATETMGDELAEKLHREVFAETVVLSWGSEEFGEGKIPGRDGKPIDFSADAVKALFKDLPDLATDVITQSQSVGLFRKVIAELDAGN